MKNRRVQSVYKIKDFIPQPADEDQYKLYKKNILLLLLDSPEEDHSEVQNPYNYSLLFSPLLLLQKLLVILQLWLFSLLLL